MATQSSSEKCHQDEVPGGPKNEGTALAPGDTCGSGIQNPVALVLTASGNAPLSGEAVRCSPAGSPGSVAVLAGEDPPPTIETCMPAEHGSDLQVSGSPQVRLSHVGFHKGARSGEGRAPEGTVAQIKSGRSNHPRKQPGHKRAEEAATSPERPQLLWAPTPQSSVSLPPSSPRFQLCIGNHSHASPRSPATRPGPALRSQAAQADPARQGGTTSTGKAQRSTYASDPGFCSSASRPGPAQRSHATLPGPALHSSTSLSGPDDRRRATPPGPVLSSSGSESGLALPSCSTPPGPVLHSGASGSGSDVGGHATRASLAFRSRATPPGPGLRSSASGSGAKVRRRATPSGPVPSSASGPGPAQRSRATLPGPGLRSSASGSGAKVRRRRATPPGPAVRNRTARSCSVSLSSSPLQRPALFRQGALPVSGGWNHLAPAALRKPVLQRTSLSPDPEAQCPPSQPVHRAVRMRASSPSPPGRYFPLFRIYDERFSSSSSSSSSFSSSSSSLTSVILSPSSSSSEFSGQSSSSSPNFYGLRSIRTPSPDSLRRALLPELDALGAAISGEQEEIRGPPSPEPPVL
ncbi:uncharacterized protein CXorf67 homolog isoform X3 [Heterocephalus glaber]|uniref:Uncharacterized protein CXorf67 homolog isoform X1 n=1 Tax=Heterocephalus glaber TaxID=10181 RepID=A0AAX6S9N4_HETGA|nr:uncharacterized protein CXorf67 homolog isoform X1 [Heterocephalus glaber]XP_021105692.1 uncharacterized protein CXorf67 homolog isoform X3 [Heterocephalus glaber]